MSPSRWLNTFIANRMFTGRRWTSLICLAICFAGTMPVHAGSWPSRLFAPYADFTAWPPYDIVGTATNTGLQYATLAFIVVDPSQNAATAPVTNLPAWGGFTEYSAASAYRVDDINAFRALGGDVIISFGGESGTELAAAVTDTNRLLAAYQFVIDTYSATRIDFDIEGEWVADHPSIDRRSFVLAELQTNAAAANRTLQISLTLPVLPTGLDNNGLYVLQSAVSNHVNLATVNIMAMDYGDNAAPSPAGRMGTYAIAAATNLFNQLKSTYQAAGIPKTDAQLWQMIGVTPMLGVNDATDEIFDQPAATQLVNFAETNSLGELAFWSLNRDQPGDSGITQTAFQFTGILLPFGGGAPPTPAVTPGTASVVEPAAGTTNLVFPVSLTPAPTDTVSVAYFTSDGTATATSDYLATSGTLVFAPGQTSASVSVVVPGHTNAGPNKVFYLNLTNAVGANLFVTQAAGTIINDNTNGGGSNSGGSGGGTTNYTGSGECAVTTQWLVTYDNGAVFQAIQTLSNPGPTNITLNSLSFEASYTNVDWISAGATSGWVKPAQSGNTFLITGGWPVAAVIPAGGSLQLTYQGEPGGNPPPPQNLVINGVAAGGCPGPPTFTRIARQGNDILLNWSSLAGLTNRLQTASSLSGPWTDIMNPMMMPGSGTVSTNWTDAGGATNGTKYYRIMVP